MKALILSVLICVTLESLAQKREVLFNGENLDGWNIVVNDTAVLPSNFFYVNDGMIETVGVPYGYIRTKKAYSDYKLHVEWRYPNKPSNSGVYIHINGPDKIWPKSFQCQLKYHNAGDFIVGGTNLSATIRDSLYVSTREIQPLIPKSNPTNEKPSGEWNSYDITCLGNTIEIKVNGLLQNTVKNCSIT